ncbi:MAG: AMP-binding protein [Bryobacteraceae bacterium]|nr:AMP-binding protein [Bryobacteraceae bacterium]
MAVLSSSGPAGSTGIEDTVPGLIERQAAITPEAPAILAPGRPVLTYRGLFESLTAARAQLSLVGLTAGDRVALVTANGPGAATSFLAIASTCGCAPLNPAYKAEELEFYLRDLGARAVVTDQGAGSAVRTAAAAAGLPVISMGTREAFPRFDAEPFAESPEPGGISPDGTALLLHTSGTTSRPKLVPLLHRNLCASARHIAATLKLTPEDRCLNIMPLFHIHGLVAAVLSTLGAGGSVVCTDGVYGSGFFQWLEEFSPTWYTAVPTMHMGILAKAREHATVIAERPLRFIRSSSSALPPQVLHELEAAFGAPVVEAYGMTEAAHQMACNPLPPEARKPGSVGPAAGPDVAIMDAEGNLLEQGATGEVVIRGANVTPGYLDNPQANETAFTNGWFRTGDQGWIDAGGYLVLTGRLKELINRGGEKISPREIDEVLLDHAEVRQALCFAVPHAQLGEEIGAAVVLATGSAATESDLRRFAAGRLAAFKVPHLICILDEIPKGPTGKPQRIGLAAKLGLGTMDDSVAAAEYRAPSTPLEEQICAIWQQTLKRDRVGTLDTFSSLGGDSLLAARMLAEVAEATGAAVAFEGFLDEGTVASIAADIERHRTAQAPTGPIVLLRAGGSKTPLVCFTGHDGILVGMSRLAHLLGDGRPVFAVEPPAPEDFPGSEWTIEDFAGRAATALAERFGTEPIHLAGICFGGVTAYETARRRQAQGGQVHSLILLDTLNRHWGEHCGIVERVAAQWAMVAERVGAHFRALWRLRSGGAGKYLAERFEAYAQNRETAARLRSRADSSPPHSVVLPELRRQAGNAYRPGPYSGRVTMIRVKGRRPSPPLMGWTGIVTGDVTLQAVDFCPRGMLAEPAVREVARIVAEAIAE